MAVGDKVQTLISFQIGLFNKILRFVGIVLLGQFSKYP